VSPLIVPAYPRIGTITSRSLCTSRARQIKRWTGKWGFVKNIPAAEMRKMVRARHRREQRLGRPTKFLRDPGTGGFQEVPSAKLDAYQQRFGSPCVSTLSSSSGTSLSRILGISGSTS